LNKSVEEFPYGDHFLDLLKKAGFKKARSKSLTFGISSLYQGEGAVGND
jgi:demethylmenaquinone methyltransferase/2-methoxy-6-polyprenyl-1,4-benzoquinol methylase